VPPVVSNSLGSCSGSFSNWWLTEMIWSKTQSVIFSPWQCYTVSHCPLRAPYIWIQRRIPSLFIKTKYWCVICCLVHCITGHEGPEGEWVCFVCFWRDSLQWARASSFTRFLDHSQWRTTVGRTPLNEWSARHRDLYLTTHNTHNRQTSMPPLGFEPTILAG